MENLDWDRAMLPGLGCHRRPAAVLDDASSLWTKNQRRWFAQHHP
jgi:hypothetical protein